MVRAKDLYPALYKLKKYILSCCFCDKVVDSKMDWSIDEYLGKKYKLTHNENLEQYLQFIGVGLIQRKLATAFSPVTTLTKNQDGSYTLLLSTPVKDIATIFRLDEEFVDERPDGTRVQSFMTMDGNKLIQTQTESNGRKSKHVREFTNTHLTVTNTAEGWNGTCIRIYEIVDDLL